MNTIAVTALFFCASYVFIRINREFQRNATFTLRTLAIDSEKWYYNIIYKLVYCAIANGMIKW
ncbi:MAG: hypothetical protein ACI4RP_00160 [Acutalibacteraceae bacterium]